MAAAECCPPPIPERSSAAPTPICYADGTMIYAVASTNQPINDLCDKVPGTLPAWEGYWDQTGTWTAGDPPSGWVPCGTRSDVELAGRVCLVDITTGEYAGSLFIEATFDTSVTPPAFESYVLAALLPDGTWQRPFVPSANLVHEPCPTGTTEPLVMHDCTPTGCVEFVRWFNSTLGTVTGDRALDGSVYAPVGIVASGPCSTDRHVELGFDVLADGTCIQLEIVKSFACDGTASVVTLDLTGAPYALVGTLSTECPCAPKTRLGVVTSWDTVATA